jgi:hypothetical protein
MWVEESHCCCRCLSFLGSNCCKILYSMHPSHCIGSCIVNTGAWLWWRCASESFVCMFLHKLHSIDVPETETLLWPEKETYDNSYNTFEHPE